MLEIEMVDSTAVIPRGRTATSSGRRKPSKNSPMEQQAFLSTLPLRLKGRRRRTSTNTSKPDLSKPIFEPAAPSINDEADHDSDATSSEDEPGKLRKARQIDGTMTPTSIAPGSGFVGLSCGKDAPTVQYVSPIKATSDVIARPDVMDGVSRFYHKRRIKIGNTSKFIPESKRSPKMAKYTHKWMIYFVSPAYSHPISTFLSSVTIFLDESFPLPRIIELRVPPFRWISYGWGEFNLNIRLVFCDPMRNKPMDVVHPLRLDPGKSGREVDGYVGYFDIDMDRNTVFLPGQAGIEYDEVPTMAAIEKEDVTAAAHSVAAPMQLTAPEHIEEEEVDPDTIRVANLRDMIELEINHGKVGRATLPKRDSFSDESVVERVSNLDDDEVNEIVGPLEPFTEQLQNSVENFPLISENGSRLSYSVAASSHQFLSWSIGRQKSVEWHRARLVQADVLESLSDASLDSASEAITTKSVVLWCRQNNYGPPALANSDDVFQYCRYCGMLEETMPRKGRKRSVSLGVDAYCRCGKDFKQQLAVLKTSSNVQDMINRFKGQIRSKEPVSDFSSLSPSHLRSLLAQTDVNMMRWIWGTMLQLELSGTKAHRNEDISQMAEEEPLAAAAVMTHAAKSFLSRLIQQARQQSTAPDADDEDEVVIVGTTSKVEKSIAPLVITPIHILRALRASTEFDFLTNAGMAT